LVVADMQEMLDLCAASEIEGMFALDPSQIVEKSVVLAVPNTLASLLGVDVDGHHRVDAALAPDLEPGIAAWTGDKRTIRTSIHTRHRNAGSRSDPGPPVAQPIEVEVVNQIVGEPTSDARDQVAWLKRTAS